VGGAALARGEKNADAVGATLLFVDESAFYLLPMAVQTWAPCGQTPVLRVPFTRDHLATISAITPDGQLFFQVQAHTYTSADVIAFLQGLLDSIAGPLVVIWDGAPIHRSKALKAFLAEGAAHRLHLERLPGYAPQLNPDEGIWHWLKRWDLHNVCCRDLAHLEQELLGAYARLHQRPEVIRSCFPLAGYFDL
jgi:transposase